jgi:hypothetical protein
MSTPPVLTGNPILDSPTLKATLAAQMAQQNAPPPPAIQMPAGGAAASPSILSGMPSMPSTPQPAVGAPRGTVAGDTNELGRKLSTGSGISQIHSKIEDSGFGQKHPVLSKVLGIGAQGLAELGDIGLRTVAPAVDLAIPGTSLHHLADVRGDQRQVAGDVANQEKEAQAGEANARANALSNPADEITPLATTGGYVGVSRKTGQADPITVNGEQAQPLEKQEPIQHAVLPDGSVIAITRGADGKVAADEVYHGDPKVQTQVTTLEIGGKPHQVIVNKDTGEQIKDLGETGEKPPTVNVNAGQNEADKQAARLGKPYEAMNTAANSQLDKIDEAVSMIHGNAEAQALGIPKTMTALVSGQGSGVRITQAELNMIAHARGVQGDFEGYINKLSGKGQLTKTQQDQIAGVLGDAKQRILLKQQIANQTLDTINGASSRDQIVQADQQARRLFGQLEKFGRYEGEILPYNGKQMKIVRISDDGKKVDLAPAE